MDGIHAVSNWFDSRQCRRIFDVAYLCRQYDNGHSYQYWRHEDSFAMTIA